MPALSTRGRRFAGLWDLKGGLARAQTNGHLRR